MGKFRKKPVEIEAVQFIGVGYMGLSFNFGEPIPEWLSEQITKDFGKTGAVRGAGQNEYILISTLEGDMRCEPGDWIIRGVKGELYPCKPDIFAATYEPA